MEGKVQFAQTAALPASSPVTAVDFLPWTVQGRYVLAVGTEVGRLSLHLVTADGTAVTELPLSAE